MHTKEKPFHSDPFVWPKKKSYYSIKEGEHSSLKIADFCRKKGIFLYQKMQKRVSFQFLLPSMTVYLKVWRVPVTNGSDLFQKQWYKTYVTRTYKKVCAVYEHIPKQLNSHSF